METFDFEQYYKRIENAPTEQLAAIRQELAAYLNDCTPDVRLSRLAAYNAYLLRADDQLRIELNFVKSILTPQEA